MDYIIQDNGYEYLIECEKERVKDTILKDYISLRKAMGFTQQEIADRTGMLRTNIVRIESGKYIPTIEVLVKLAEAMNMELEIRMVPKGEKQDGKGSIFS